MLLIWGFRFRGKAVGEGTFACPRCGADRAYVLKAFRRWFTLFFLPVFPVGAVKAEQVECQTCRQAFTPAVLTAPRAADVQQDLAHAAREVATAVLRAADSPAGRAAAATALTSFSAEPWQAAWVDADVAGLDLEPLSARLSRLTGTLSEQGKERLVGVALAVATADGQPSEAALAVVRQVAAGLEMTAAHAHGLIDQAVRAQS